MEVFISSKSTNLNRPGIIWLELQMKSSALRFNKFDEAMCVLYKSIEIAIIEMSGAEICV